MIITFCGHSGFLESTNDETNMLKLFERLANGRQVDFYLGGYGNFDAFAKRCAKKYKESHFDARLCFVTPYLNKWLDERKKIIEKEYDDIIYPGIENIPLKYAISKRNEWMVDCSDCLIVYVNAHFGGAYNALIYADKHKKRYINVFNEDYNI